MDDKNKKSQNENGNVLLQNDLNSIATWAKNGSYNLMWTNVK